MKHISIKKLSFLICKKQLFYGNARYSSHLSFETLMYSRLEYMFNVEILFHFLYLYFSFGGEKKA